MHSTQQTQRQNNDNQQFGLKDFETRFSITATKMTHAYATAIFLHQKSFSLG